MTRPELLERRPAWGEGATTLEPLAGDDARLLVDALPERDALDEKLAATILETAAGVPLFLEQLAAHAAEAGLADDRVPMTIDALLASRIDALEPGERAVLSRAAVVGRAFSRESLGALIPDAERRELPGRLASLERRRLVRPRGPEHEFVHPLVRGAAYDAIGRPERAAMHEAFARWLDDRGEADELVGTHLERAALDTAGGRERGTRSRDAARRLGDAGRRALSAADHAAAANLLERATRLLDDHDPERMELECNLGHALKGLGEGGGAIELLQGTTARARAAGNRRIELRAGVEMLVPRIVQGLPVPEASAYLDEALVVFQQEDDVLGMARAESTYAYLSAWRKRWDDVLAHGERAEAAYRRLGRRGDMDVFVVFAAVCGTTSVPHASRLCKGALETHADSPRRRAYLLLDLGSCLALSGDILGARDTATAAVSILGELGEELGLGTSALFRLGDLEALTGDWSRAGEYWRRGLDYTRDRPGLNEYHTYFLARLGEAALEQAAVKPAARLAEQASAAAVVSDVETDIWWRRVAARALSATGHARKAVRLGREALAIADETDDVLLRSGARLDLAEVQLGAGRMPEARTLARDALDILDRKGAALPAARARERFADLLADEEERGAAVAAPL
jgi:tetratricopeptide (TPR) repeat protein